MSEPDPMQDLAQGMSTVASANGHGAEALTVLQVAAEAAKQAHADLVDVVDEIGVTVAIRHRQTGEQRTVPRAALPFFTSQGYELVDQPVDQPTPDPETPGRHEGN